MDRINGSSSYGVPFQKTVTASASFATNSSAPSLSSRAGERRNQTVHATMCRATSRVPGCSRCGVSNRQDQSEPLRSDDRRSSELATDHVGTAVLAASSRPVMPRGSTRQSPPCLLGVRGTHLRESWNRAPGGKRHRVCQTVLAIGLDGRAATRHRMFHPADGRERARLQVHRGGSSLSDW